MALQACSGDESSAKVGDESPSLADSSVHGLDASVAPDQGLQDTALGKLDTSHEADTVFEIQPADASNADTSVGETMTVPDVDLCQAVDCDDGDACTGIESCDPGTGKCLPGEPIACDDGNPCNGKELCAPATGDCVAVDVVTCSDDDACNGVETCDEATGECVVGTPVACDDGDACNGVETCAPETGECLPGASIACDDGNACNGIESCVPATGECASTEPVLCDDENACNGLEVCDPPTGACVPGEPVTCDDENACNGLETCVPGTGACLPGVMIECDDGDACNGLESCNPSNGLCEAGTPIACDDGDGCNGIETCDPVSGNCVTTGAIGTCPVSPNECDENGEIYGPDGDKAMLAPTANMIRLRDSGMSGDKAAIIASIKAHPSVEAATYSDVMNNLNRTGTEVDWVLGVECFAKGYKFNSGDNNVDHWWPQGMSGSATGGNTNSIFVAGEVVHLVSWYHKPEEDPSTNVNKGMRLSFVRRTLLSDVAYRNILMVEPVIADDGTPTFKPVVGHAGGIVWYKNLLYVADTSKGFRVFDMNHLMKVKTGDKDLIGYSAAKNEYHGFNYAYVLPMVNRYKLCEESCCARFSFCSLDMSVTPPRIISGEYTDKNSKARIHSWEIDEGSGWLALDPGQDTATADALFYPAAIRLQGATIYNGIAYLSSSNPKSNWPQTPGTLYVAVDGQVPVKRGYPTLPEDLYHNHVLNYLWTVTEYPGLRYVFAVDRSDALLGCN